MSLTTSEGLSQHTVLECIRAYMLCLGIDFEIEIFKMNVMVIEGQVYMMDIDSLVDQRDTLEDGRCTSG